MTALRRSGTFATWTALGLVFAILLAAAVPLALGDRSYTMRSGSMAPTIETGDVVVTRPISPLSARVGDIVTFKDPEGSGRLYSHRVQRIVRRGDRVAVTTRGDANTSTERWTVSADGSIGKVLYRVPKVGYGLIWLDTMPARIVLILLPALLLVGSALTRIWRPKPELGGRTG